MLASHCLGVFDDGDRLASGAAGGLSMAVPKTGPDQPRVLGLQFLLGEDRELAPVVSESELSIVRDLPGGEAGESSQTLITVVGGNQIGLRPLGLPIFPEVAKGRLATEPRHSAIDRTCYEGFHLGDSG